MRVQKALRVFFFYLLDDISQPFVLLLVASDPHEVDLKEKIVASSAVSIKPSKQFLKAPSSLGRGRVTTTFLTARRSEIISSSLEHQICFRW